ncbi:MAG: PaaI family thioesterase [Thermoleophilia bacterium]|jgi:1,4-dihydroxy-2-naphthoyl-CoA hydrolase|nr:PaaI family thioesterase [Thermoleophilia bacterium]
MNSSEPPQVPVEGTLGEVLGITGYERPSDDLARAEIPVLPRIMQPYGIVHGGAYAALAESVTSRATYEVVGPDLGAFGQANDTSFLRPVSSGTVRAEARARHRGRTSWVWEVEMRDDGGRLCALSRVTIAVRPLRGD